MTLNDLAGKILQILPNASFGEDLDGQIVIYTNLREHSNEELIDIDDRTPLPG